MAEISLEDDEVVDSAAMAEAMGFSGFGMQRPPSKKRKFNPHADAAVSTSSNGSSKPASTGANTAPLGQRMRLPPPSSNLPARPPTTATETSGPVTGKADTDEIDLLGDDDGHGANEDDERYLDTSRPSRGYLPEELAEIAAQDKIDAILAAGSNSIPGLPARPEGFDSSDGYGHGQQQQHGGRRNHQRGRGGNENQQRPSKHHRTGGEGSGAPWWEGYYDPSVNQNPWEALEKKMRLQPRGTWLPKDTKPVDLGIGTGEGQGTDTIVREEVKEAHGEGHMDK